MIDTVVLKVPHPKFIVTYPDMFTPNPSGLYRAPFLPFHGQPYIKCVNNPKKSDKDSGVYRPRLTIFKRVGGGQGGFAINLHIELSLPKLLYGNNFDELRNADFDTVIATLKKQLLFMGVMVSKENLESAEVHTVHYSKNVTFTDYATASQVLSLIPKMKLTKRLDLNRTHFINDGEAVRSYAKSHEFVMYDKIADLQQSQDRATEKSDRQFNPQMDMFTEMRKALPIEVLRLELRLKSRQKMKAFFAKLDITNDLTFWSIFSENVSQRCIQHYWQDIYDALRPVLLQDLTPTEQCALIMRQRREWTPQRVLALVGLCVMLREDGHRKLRREFEKKFSPRTLQRMYKDVKGLDFKIINRAQPFEQVTQALAEYKPSKLKDIAPALHSFQV